jgi:hypothetical protein
VHACPCDSSKSPAGGSADGAAYVSNTLHTACAKCHTNFTPEFFADTHNPDQWVGALIQRVPIDTDH